MAVLLLAVVAMLVQQTMASIAKTAVPVMFKALADDLGFEAELVLLFTWVFAAIAVLVMLGCGAFIIRYGALRISQAGALLTALGLIVVALTGGTPIVAMAVLLVSALLLGMGITASTPASSQILARYAPPRWGPLVFSIKQTGVPAGVAIASFCAPLLVEWVGWRGAALFFSICCLTIAVLLQPCRARFDSDRDPSHPLRLSSLKQNISLVLQHPELRLLAATTFAFVGLQSIYTNFTVVYLAEELNYSLRDAGQALAIATVVAAPGRIVWGWVGSTLIAPRYLLAVLALVMTVATVAMGCFDRAWPYWAVMLTLVGISATALSWHGVLLAEVARIAPLTRAGQLTGGVLAFGSASQTVAPLLFGLGYLLASYTGAYVACALPALTVGVLLLYAPVRTKASRPDEVCWRMRIARLIWRAIPSAATRLQD